MAKQLNVNLAFTADTSQAKRNIEELQVSLNKISSISHQAGGLQLTKDMQQAVNSAKDLQTHLNNAFNIKTGNLDLNMLNASLKKANTDLATLGQGLLKAGIQGEEAFMNVQRAVATASVQIKQSNTLLGEMWTTLKNTARWQISSSILHGFMGFIQSAYGYAQRLDESLNNIRIVTGQNTEQMAKFAEQANKTAKALSTTTVDYTNASLIYYQQGLADSEVIDRTNVTIKMANAAGESAEKVSDQLTAVWNNFYDGSKSLEYYADVMTALGAATASSTDEISEGLNKFAAVAETVGLSYEYAASALATVTATTRQSADIVGTAFKTLFARIQDLELGKTLDDGTSLGKYSAALAAVGVNIKDSNGELKEMDQILEEMASKWNTLNKDQQVSLAQTVAGVRQYTQLIALMDNWDFMEENLSTSYGASGTLNEQQKIYEESWEAANKRLKASMEALYSDLIPEEFLIKMTDAISDVVDVLDILIDSFGGIGNILLLISTIALNKMGPSIANGLNLGAEKLQQLQNGSLGLIQIFSKTSMSADQLNSELSQISGENLTTATKQIDYFNTRLKDGTSNTLKMSQSLNQSALSAGNLTTAFEGYLKDTSQVYNLQALIEQNADKLTSAEKERLSIMQEQLLNIAQQKKELQTQLDILNQRQSDAAFFGDSSIFSNRNYSETNAGSFMATNLNDTSLSLLETWTQLIEKATGFEQSVSMANNHLLISSQSVDGIGIGANTMANSFGSVVKINEQINQILQQQGVATQDKKIKIREILALAVKENQITKEIAQQYENSIKGVRNQERLSNQLSITMSKVIAQVRQIAEAYGNSNSYLDQVEKNIKEIFNLEQQVNSQQAEYNQLLQDSSNLISQFGNKFNTVGGMLTKGFQGLSTIAMGISSISNAFQTLGDESAGFGQKLTSFAMAGTMGMSAFKAAISGIVKTQDVLSISLMKSLAIQKSLDSELVKSTLITALKNNVTEQGVNIDGVKNALMMVGIPLKKAEGFAEQFATIQKERGTAAAIKQTVANMKLAASEAAVLWPLLAIAAALAAIAVGIAIWDKLTVSTEEAAKSMKETADAYKEAKDELESLDNSLQSVKDRIEELEAMDSLSIVEEEELEKLREEESLLQTQKDIQEEILQIKREAAALEFEANSGKIASKLSEKPTIRTHDNYGQAIELTSEEFKEKYVDPAQGTDFYDDYLKTYQDLLKKEAEWLDENLEVLVATKEGFNAWLETYNGDYQSAEAQQKLTDIKTANKGIYGDNYEQQVLESNRVQNALADSSIDFDAIVKEAYIKGQSENISEEIKQAINENSELYQKLFTQGVSAQTIADYYQSSYKTIAETLGEEQFGSLMGDLRWEDVDLTYLKQIKDLSSIQDNDEIFALIDNLKEFSINQRGSSEAKTLGLDIEEFEIYRNLLLETTDVYDDNTVGLNKVAIANKRMEKGVKDLASDWEDLNEVMSDENAELEDVSAALAKIKGPLQNILNLSDEQFELLSEDFARDNWDLIQDVINGVEGSVDELRDKAGESILLNIEGAIDPNGELNQQLVDLHNQILDLDGKSFEVGVKLDPVQNAEFYASCNEIINAAKMTQEQAEAYFAALGYDVELKNVTVPQDTTTWHIDNPVLDTAATSLAGVPIFKGQPEVLTGTNTTMKTNAVAVKTITPNGSYGGGVGVKTTAPSSARKSSSGGDSKPKTAKPVNKSDTVDRYKEVNDSIEDLQHNLDISNKKADALWGEARFKEMRKGVKILEEENELLKEKARLADAYLAEDTAALKKAAGAAGINFTFNADGNISNYTTEMTKLWKKLDNTITSANRDGNVSDAEQERIDKLQEKVDAVKDAISQYEDTLKTKQDIDKEYLDNQKEIWDTNFDILTESLEYNLSFNEADLELIDYYLSKMEDDMFKLAEAYTKLNEKSIEYSDNLDIQRQHYEDLTESFKNGKISESQYKEALLESQSAIVDTLQSLLDLDKEMQEYYGKTLDKAAEEIDIYSDKIDHLNSVLDHYNNIMDLTGKSKDYEAMGTILEGQAENLHNQLQIAKEEYDMYKTQAEYWEQMMASVDETDPAFEVYKKNWDAAVIATNDAQDEMLSKTQEWAEAMRAVIENELADIGQTLEKSITGGTSFDELLTSMERANSLQEEYLTDTNKIYETNKLIRTAQQEIDKTTNTVAKNKLKQFVNETNQLQEQTKLSEYELKIQQAKYDLIIAEIALEEAQQAKSMVRLTRDSEGNFGYVYTADQNQIDVAQQKLEDAQNNLYNIGLEGANDYSQKYAETMQEMYDTLQEIQTAFLNGEIATQEEYNRRMLEAKEYYFDKLKDFSNLYQVALTTDSRVVNDAWSSDFNDMIYKTEELKSAVNDYADQSAGILKEWADTVKETIDGSGLDDVNQAVSGIVFDSEKLTEVLSGEDGLISKLNEEIDKVKESTSEYALKRAEIQGLIADYEKLAEQINADYDDKNITAPETTLPSESAENKPESATGPASKTSLGVGSAVKVKAGAIWYGNSYGGGSSGRARNGTILYINESGTHPYNIDGLGWVRKEDLESFKSGGYTGAWGSYGKLALLDEKELILNKGDTSNFLASMEVLERILSIIDLHSANAQLSGVLSAPGFNHVNERSIEQNVHIEASFPGVQDRNEIEEAFNNLINQASQYANRN